VNSSGSELEMALMVAPRTPLLHPRPMTSEIWEIHSLEYQIKMLESMTPRRISTNVN